MTEDLLMSNKLKIYEISIYRTFNRLLFVFKLFLIET